MSNATSTFILRVSRAHFKIVWAALTIMNVVPVKDGKRCIFRVIRVSGTIRKAEEEAIRRAQEMIRKAKRQEGCKDVSSLLDGCLSTDQLLNNTISDDDMRTETDED